MARQLSSEVAPPFEFTNPEVAEKYIPVGVKKDFQARVPQKKWYGKFSTITPDVAEQLMKENYNRLKLK